MSPAPPPGTVMMDGAPQPQWQPQNGASETGTPSGFPPAQNDGLWSVLAVSGPSERFHAETVPSTRPDPIPGVKLPPGVNTGVINLLALRKKNKFVLPVAGVVIGMFGILVLAGMVSAVRSCGKSNEPVAATSASATPATSAIRRQRAADRNERSERDEPDRHDEPAFRHSAHARGARAAHCIARVRFVLARR